MKVVGTDPWTGDPPAKRASVHGAVGELLLKILDKRRDIAFCSDWSGELSEKTYVIEVIGSYKDWDEGAMRCNAPATIMRYHGMNLRKLLRRVAEYAEPDQILEVTRVEAVKTLKVFKKVKK